MLLEIVADRVESLCGFKPGPDMVATFLKNSVAGRTLPPVSQARPVIRATPPLLPPSLSDTAKTVLQPAHASVGRADLTHYTVAPHGRTGFSFEGQFHPARNAIDTLRQVFDLFIKRDPTFGDRFAGLPMRGRTRRYLARNVNELYRDRPDLGFTKLDSRWFMSTNHSKQTIGQIITMACDVADVTRGRDLIDSLGD